MGLLSSLFRSRESVSPLRAFAERLGPETVMRGAEAVNDPSLRAASAVSLSVLMTGAKFYKSLSEMVTEAGRAAGVRRSAVLPYDVVVFEGSAFAQYHLLQDFLSPGFDDDDFDDEPNDPFTTACREALHISAGLLKDYMSTEAADQLFVNRMMRYSLKRTSALGEFDHLLSCGINSGTPLRSAVGQLSLDLATTVGIKMYLPIFAKTLLPGLQETCRRLIDHYVE